VDLRYGDAMTNAGTPDGLVEPGLVELTGEQWLERAGADPAPPGAEAEPRPAQVTDGIAIHDPDRSAPDLAASHRPLAGLVASLVAVHDARRQAVTRFTGPALGPTPYVVGVTGAVAAGKSVTAHVLAATLTAAHGVRAEVVSTDGFLFDNGELEARGLSDRKGYPESYDHLGLISFLETVKAGRAAGAPVYDHDRYDVIDGRTQLVDRPDVLVLEGLNVLQPAPPPPDGPADRRAGLLVSDFVDFAVYVDADEDDLLAWFLLRLQALRAAAAGDPSSFFAAFEGLSDDAFAAAGRAVWAGVNRPNLVDHIAPTRDRADLVMEKARDHSVRRVVVRPR